MKVEWKKVSSALVEAHNEQGAAGYLLSGRYLPPGLSVVNLTPDEELLRLKGPKVGVKPVRSWLWKNRKKRMIQRDRALLYSAYDETGNFTFVGVGAVTDSRVAQRLEELRRAS